MPTLLLLLGFAQKCHFNFRKKKKNRNVGKQIWNLFSLFICKNFQPYLTFKWKPLSKHFMITKVLRNFFVKKKLLQNNRSDILWKFSWKEETKMFMQTLFSTEIFFQYTFYQSRVFTELLRIQEMIITKFQKNIKFWQGCF